jgi:hypothetical protein
MYEHEHTYPSGSRGGTFTFGFAVRGLDDAAGCRFTSEPCVFAEIHPPIILGLLHFHWPLLGKFWAAQFHDGGSIGGRDSIGARRMLLSGGVLDGAVDSGDVCFRYAAISNLLLAAGWLSRHKRGVCSLAGRLFAGGLL